MLYDSWLSIRNSCLFSLWILVVHVFHSCFSISNIWYVAAILDAYRLILSILRVYLCVFKSTIQNTFSAIIFVVVLKCLKWAVLTQAKTVKRSVQLLSLLLEALACPDQEVQRSTLCCLEPLLMEPPPALIQQLEALVTRLLALSCSPVMVCRVGCWVMLGVLHAKCLLSIGDEQFMKIFLVIVAVTRLQEPQFCM